ncbi:MAG: polysaccharide deacetylase family protein, partial [Polyangiaceae bacterium]
MTRLAAFSVDLDEVHEYWGVHGLGVPPADVERLVYRTALPRILEFAERLALPLTLFAIGRDLDQEGGQALAPFVERGDEVGNHSAGHRYDLSRLSREERRREITQASTRIEALTGELPRGFRAPGYVLSQPLVEDLEALGFAYDSSVFACPAYYLAKLAVMGGQGLIGRRSRSIVSDPQVLFAPSEPYRAGKRYFLRGNGLREVPITLTRRLRLPYFGTSLGALAAPPFASPKIDWFTRGVSQLSSVN